MKVKGIIVNLWMLLAATSLQAQITIGGNVYGGGNEGNVGGNTTVTVRAGDLNKVYGGARMADVGGRAFVNVDGEHASGYMLINYVYGGNDIAGTIGTSAEIPTELTEVGDKDEDPTKNEIDNTWNTFVRISTKTITTGTSNEAVTTEDPNAKKIYVGQLFGGGNGDYDYTTQSNNPYYGLAAPNLGKTYLELLGGSIVNAFGGGNMATVTEDVVIHLNNPSTVVNHIKVNNGVEDDNGTDLLTEARFIKMGINYKFTYPNSDAFQIGNLFGGNNKVDMAIQPKWNLLGGKVRNLYSGGNEGRMTCPQGLLLVIPANSTLKVDNVYGGCRKSDVRPLDAMGNDIPNAQIQLANNPTGIPAGFAARTRILGGNVNNVYGGNDISGNVYGGNTVAILTTIHGSVYGGGNGSYAYTDNPDLKDELLWRDFYYDPDSVLTAAEKAAVTNDSLLSVTALNKVRPNAEQVSLLLRGTAGKPVFVEGSVFVGGNSASLRELTAIPNRQAHVKIGSYVTIDNLFLGNNGENMVKTDIEQRDNDGNLIQAEGVLRTIASDTIASNHTKFNSMDLTKSAVFDKYMEGCAMKVLPSVVFDDVEDYDEYSSQFGSLYCGGNVGSMMTDGLTEITFSDKVIIYDKIVGGCNKANVAAVEGFNAAYYGGLLGNPDSHDDKLKINFSGLKVQPMRWKKKADKSQGLVWNTVKYNTTTQKFEDVPNVTPTEPNQNIQSTSDDIVRRLKGGNIYGGCYESGHVNGNVILNINETLMERDKLFDLTNEGDILYENTEKGKYTITKRNTGVILSEQGMDVLGDALNVFGAGYGAASEIWGSTTINLNKGYVFQIFGGGEMGAIGRKKKNGEFDETGEYVYDPAYSTYINLNGEASLPGVARETTGDSPDMAECEFIYGGAFEGVIAGDTHINLGNGRIFNSFAGSCNADILGHTETYVGRNKKADGTYEDGGGFPWIRDHIYGGNDLGGSILGDADFSGRIRDDVSNMVAEAYEAQVEKATTYMEYTQGRVRNILGGCFGDYDYNNDPAYKVGTGADCRVAKKPYLHNAFVNFRPNTNVNNAVDKIFGAGEGYSGDRDGDKGQDHSYVLIDIPDNVENFANTEVFGAGAYNGLGMRYTAEETLGDNPIDLNEASAIIDLMRGKIGAAYGGSYEEGVTRRTVVNVPDSSTIKIGSIFGGAYGSGAYRPCDVYEANVNYLTKKDDAYLICDPTGTNKLMKGAIFGGNNYARRTLYGKINISARVRQKHPTYGMTTATIYGAGCGSLTWNEYTEVNLDSCANVWEVYGGGEAGGVMSAESVQEYIKHHKPNTLTAAEWTAAWTLGSGYDPASLLTDYTTTDYVNNKYTNLLENPLVRIAEMDDRDYTGVTNAVKEKKQFKYNTNVLIKEGAYVGNYAYGGGYGNANDAFVGSGDVYGTTYIALLGGTVGKDIYAAGTSGSVYNLFGAENYKASANAYIGGGTVRNVYGGGWRGSVGYHKGAIGIVSNNTSDIDGEVHVVVGTLDGTSLSHTSGIPSITRNVYGGGEGGAIYGDAYVKMNKGYIGYRYNSTGTDDNKTEDFDERYVPELDDVEAGDNKLDLGGNIFGGGYVANSYVDRSHVTMMGGIVRGSLYGGGEIGPIGRGTVHADSIEFHKNDGVIMNGAAIYKGGETHVYLWDGHVMRDVFGGGRGYDNWNGEGYMTDEEKKTMDKSSKGYVFGSTDVHIYGGEVGTETNVLKGYGNVFGGGNEGFVYSATGTKSDDGYYRDSSSKLSADCKIAVEPQCKVLADGGVEIGGTHYAKGTYVPVEELNKLKSRAHDDSIKWKKLDTRGIVIHNALFAGGNITEGSDKIFANTVTVFGNAAASLRDVYNFDLISLGTEEMGGLYGDGNLTLVDGFRELHIDNYGTDYYSLKKTMSIDEYKALTARQQAYYKLKYGANITHTYTYYESKQLHTYKYTDSDGNHEVSFRKGQKITPETYNAFGDNLSDPFNNESPQEKSFWTSGSKSYLKDEQIEEGEYSLMDGKDSETVANKTGEKKNWTLLGVTSIYAGRPMNTIQRADLCGVFGSRMVMKGAVDRAPQVNGGVDYNSYTINRVDEVSLNRRATTANDTSDEDKEHGNYFGIYNSVKYLGNLTSDVEFGDVRKTDTNIGEIQADETTSYYNWKIAKPQSKYRNNGISQNMVALASGVYLELKKEETESAGEDKWGYITGIIELDLINVMPGMGGGYVYAKNEHGTPSQVESVNKVSLLSYNANASTYRQFTYTSPNDTTHLQAIETSGNFVHNTKQIVDDCYPNGGIYNDGYLKSPAHYWFIRGSIYVYEQYISAFTGSANATAEKQEIPLTITAASNGRMTLRDVKPNYYAYYDKGGNKLGTENADSVFVVNNVSYKLNQAISSWDYNLLSDGDKAKFVDKTYIVVEDCKIDETEYKKGTVMLESDYTTLKNSHPTIKYMEGDEEKTDGSFAYFFRSSNNLGHNTGYVLTYDVNNPMVWNNYYTKTASPGQANALNTQQYVIDGKDKDGNTITKSDYTEGPTYTLKPGVKNTVFGQQDYTLGSIIYGTTKTTYDNTVYNRLSDKTGQAQVEQAYVVTKEYSVKNEAGEEVQKLTVGTPIYKTKYTDAQWAAITGAHVAELAKVCTSLLEFSSTDYVWAGKVLSSADIEELKTKIIAKNKYVDDANGTKEEKATTFLSNYLDDAYYCTSAGKYGGIYFESGKAYRALDTWCSMTAEERKNFNFNYDAFDLFIDPDYSGEYGSVKTQYDGTNTNKVYSSSQPIDYQAEFVGYKNGEAENVTSVTYHDKAGTSHTISKSTKPDDWLSREAYEAIPNEKRHYSPIIVTAPGKYYMVKTPFMDGEVPYTTGQQIDSVTYVNLGSVKQANIDVFKFVKPSTNPAENLHKAVTNPQKKDSENQPMVDSEGNPVYDPITYYYCRNTYPINEKGEGKSVTTTAVTKNNSSESSHTYIVGSTDDEVPQGVVIDEAAYDGLCNFQKGFVVHGTSPTEVSTLYVSSESDINDLSAEKIITVVYLYEYDESDESGLNVTPVSERHILNIHINFKSGVPEIGDIKKPDIVLPGTTIGLNIPSVTQGAYRVTESGWEIFSNADDAATHYNGTPFVNNETPLYWYQNNYWIAYYAQTILGKTYSKSVPLSVANYHDLKKVMDDTQSHYYIDHQNVERAPKIYINDYTTDDPTTSQNGLDLLKQLFDLTYATGEVDGHQPLNSRVRGGNNLEFFLRTDIDHTGSKWTPIANSTDESGECFSATLHGDGHTISGLDHSLINHLCGHIYNLGVSGSFTSSGIAEWGDGYIENSWIKTTGTPAANTHPLFGNPTADAYQVVNCYYLENDDATGKYTPFSAEGKNMAVKKPESAFYNGEVAYNLNGFYLNKRYYTGTNANEPATPTDQKLTSGSWYVENRFADGDFIYANGTIPESVDERAETDEGGNPVTDANGKLIYYPKWPDDYLFFGQTLDYGYGDNPRHQDVPSSITALNRVYRAPAYFRSHEMRAAHFNANAVFAHNKKDDVTTLAHKDMTAIDFTGYNDAFNPADGKLKPYLLPTQTGPFYAPLLDDDGLTNFRNEGLTRNLLVYTGTAGPASAATDAVVEAKLTDKAYTETYATYRTVAEVTDTTSISGHWVQWQGGSVYKAFRDHFLVDKNDFYCPIEYAFTDGTGETDEHRMWYQRKPDLYVDRTKGWQDVSLPFTADIVTTHQKGEITHFYGSSSTGHEYWLREFKGNIKPKEGESGVMTADFNRPAATGNSTDDKTVTNTYLWDYYYYERTDPRHLDLNTDEYQTYYNSERTYSQYSRLQAATPYLIGFPGITYYEFDLSGNWTTSTTAYPQPNQLEQQIITFASKTGEKISVSDQAETGVTKDKYTFTPNYLNRSFAPGTTNTFVLNEEGSSYDAVPAASTDLAITVEPVEVYAFRPYFIQSSAARSITRSIVFSNDDSEMKGVIEHGDPTKDEAGTLNIYAKKHKIIVESALGYSTDVRIVNLAGITINAFTIEPGETVETRINTSGVYIVQPSEARYVKKLSVK